MATMWEARELERRTAARIAAAGFVPAVNVVHADTQSEFDVYAFLPGKDSFDRLMVECSLPAPNSQKLSALKGNATSFGAQHALYVTARAPHQDQMKLAQVHEVSLLSESPSCASRSAIVAGIQINVQQALSPREEFIRSFLRCVASLRRIALDRGDHSCASARLLESWYKLDEVTLIHDPFQRLVTLYEIHFSAPSLAEQCALAEELDSNGRRALYKAYAYNQGTYTQSALALQTLNRVHTLIAFCECACLVGQGTQIPDNLDDPSGRVGPLIRWLAGQPKPHMLGIVAFEFVYGWGGLWRIDTERTDWRIVRDMDVTGQEVNEMRGYVDHLFRAHGMERFIKPAEYKGVQWENLVLLPYFSKGLALRRLEREIETPWVGFPWDSWKNASIRLEGECRHYEQQH